MDGTATIAEANRVWQRGQRVQADLPPPTSLAELTLRNRLNEASCRAFIATVNAISPDELAGSTTDWAEVSTRSLELDELIEQESASPVELRTYALSESDHSIDDDDRSKIVAAAGFLCLWRIINPANASLYSTLAKEIDSSKELVEGINFVVSQVGQKWCLSLPGYKPFFLERSSNMRTATAARLAAMIAFSEQAIDQPTSVLAIRRRIKELIGEEPELVLLGAPLMKRLLSNLPFRLITHNSKPGVASQYTTSVPFSITGPKGEQAEDLIALIKTSTKGGSK